MLEAVKLAVAASASVSCYYLTYLLFLAVGIFFVFNIFEEG